MTAPIRALLLCPALLLVAAGCETPRVNLWPFGEGATELDRRPANATEYRCEGGGGFFVRNLPDGAVWLIAPDREIRLERVGGAQSGRYATGRVALEISGQSATLADPPASFAGCKLAAPAK